MVHVGLQSELRLGGASGVGTGGAARLPRYRCVKRVAVRSGFGAASSEVGMLSEGAEVQATASRAGPVYKQIRVLVYTARTLNAIG